MFKTSVRKREERREEEKEIAIKNLFNAKYLFPLRIKLNNN